MHNSKKSMVVATLAATGLVLTACDGGGGGGGQDGQGGSEGEGYQVNEQPRDALKDGGKLVLAGDADLPAQWNPMHVNGNLGSTSDIRHGMVVDNWDYDAEGLPTPNENYLLDFSDELVDNKTVVTLTLNPEAVWASGGPITWEDYEATLTACNGENEEYQCVQTDPYEKIESIEMGADEYQVVVTFKGPAPDWTSTLSGVYPKEGLKDAKTFNKGWLEFPEGYFTGPFTIEKVDKAQQIITQVPSDSWWGDAPKLDQIQYQMIELDAAPTAYANAEIDAFEVGPDPNAYQIAQGRADGEIRQATSPDWRHITMNSEGGLIKELEVRQAISMGLDRASIAASDLAGLPQDNVVVLNNHLFMNGQAGYVDNSGTLSHNPEGAATLLDEAGWVLNEETGIREKDGKPLKVKFSVLTGVPVSENEGQLVQAQLKEIGIDVELFQQDTATWVEALDTGDFELMAFSWLGTPYPMANIAQIYGDPEKNSSNFANLAIPGIQEKIDAVATEVDVEARRALANEADALIWEYMHTLPLYQRPQIYATVKDLANYGASGLSTTRKENWGYVAAES